LREVLQAPAWDISALIAAVGVSIAVPDGTAAGLSRGRRDGLSA
jgi:hypothetical protein